MTGSQLHAMGDCTPALHCGCLSITPDITPTSPCGELGGEVAPELIEQIVGTPRRRWAHIARANSAEQTVYIMHPYHCLERTPDPRDCPYSRALKRGIEPDRWASWENFPVTVGIILGRLRPIKPAIERTIS